MFFAQITHRMAITDFTAKFPQIRITLPQQKDYAPSLWSEMQHKTFATFSEPTAGGELLYKLTFKNEILHFLQVSMNGDFTQEAHLAISAIAGQIVTTQSSRGIAGTREITPLLAWKELIESPLPDSGRPDERYIRVFSALWTVPDGRAQLSYTWTWPGQLYLEYREEKQ